MTASDPMAPDPGECPVCGCHDGYDDCDGGLNCPYTDDNLWPSKREIKDPTP